MEMYKSIFRSFLCCWNVGVLEYCRDFGFYLAVLFTYSLLYMLRGKLEWKWGKERKMDGLGCCGDVMVIEY